MSQRIFKTDKFEVLTGWDRPLNRFFLVIERLDAKDDDPDEGYAFDNLRLPDPSMTLESIDVTLRRFGVIPPPTLFTDLVRDRHNDCMKRHVYAQT